MNETTHLEPLGEDYHIVVSKSHKFGTDAFLLADFARVRPGEQCCDLGSGCGIIPLLWFRWGNAPAVAYGVELQEQGYRQMLETVALGGLGEQLRPILADLRDLGKAIPRGHLNVVTCNPPYKRSGHGVPCPADARLTARHEVDCTLEDVCATAAGLLRFGGRLCICQRPERLVDILEVMRAHKLEPKRLRFVHQRPDKAPWLVLVEGRRGGRPFLTVEPPLIVAREDGSFTPEMTAIYKGEAK